MSTDITEQNESPMLSPSILTAVIIAAVKVGDKQLETVARRELQERHGAIIRFDARVTQKNALCAAGEEQP